MIHYKFIFLMACLSAFLPKDIKSQDIDMEQTLNYINGKLRPVSELTVDRGIIVSRYFNNGQIVREDQVMCKDLNMSSVNYDSQAGILSINCKTGSKCVDRQMFVRKIQRDYGRISFPVKLDPKSASGLQKALKHMVNLVMDPKYKSSEPFE
jgi:hypothetical protein